MPQARISGSRAAAATITAALLGMVLLHNLPSGSLGWLLEGRMLTIHLLMEMFAIVIAVMIVVVCLHSLNETDDPVPQALACGLLVVAVVDVMHALTYKGMPAFLTESSTQRAIYFWLCGRFVEVLTLWAIVLGLAPRLSRGAILVVGFGVASVLVWVGSSPLDALPALFVEGKGVTVAKRYCELALFTLNIGVAVMLRQSARRTGDAKLNLLALSAALMGIGELAFVSYKAPSDLQNILGHVYKIAAYALLYTATFAASIRAPFLASKAAIAAAREAETRLRNLGENLPNTLLFSIATCDGGETFESLEIRGSIQSMTGASYEEVLRDPARLSDNVWPEDLPKVIAARRKAVQQMAPTEARIRIRDLTGATRYRDVTWAPRVAADDAIILEGIATDVTEKVESATARRALEDQLAEARRLEAMGTLASGIAHDFNNVLGSIVGNAALAKEASRRQEPDEAIFCADQVLKAAGRARELVRQILTFGRRQQTNRQVQCMRPILEETASLLRVSTPAGARMDIDLGGADLAVLADTTQLQQMVLNLCTNALYAVGETPGGRVRLAVREEDVRAGTDLSRELTPGRYVLIEVADNGVGMSEETQKRLFEPFFSTKPLGVGTGLGMAVVHGVVKSHDGAIRVDSVLGSGTTFRVYLPLAQAESASQATGRVDDAARASMQGVRVLYVDDDEIMCLMVERLLARDGAEVTCEQDPSKALGMLEASPERFDVLVTDFNMPEVSGLDVLRRARAIRQQLPAILSTGALTPALAEQVSTLGGVRAMEKQHTWEQLVPLIGEVMPADRTEEVRASVLPGSGAGPSSPG